MTATSASCPGVPAPDRGKRSPEEVLRGVARELAAGDALVWQRLLRAHRPDRSGRCALCVGAVWPCTLHGVAERARSIAGAEGRSPREGSHHP